MEEKAPCPYCENFEGAGFLSQGKWQFFNFCPICGKPFTQQGAKALNQRKEAICYDRPLL